MQESALEPSVLPPWMVPEANTPDTISPRVATTDSDDIRPHRVVNIYPDDYDTDT